MCARRLWWGRIVNNLSRAEYAIIQVCLNFYRALKIVFELVRVSHIFSVFLFIELEPNFNSF